MIKLSQTQKNTLQKEMYKKFKNKERIKTGVEQVIAIWEKKDGSFKELSDFCQKYFIDDEKQLIELRNKLEFAFEKLGGHLLEVHSVFSHGKDVELGEFTPHDELLSSFNPYKHLTDDLFEIKLPFVILINFKIEDFKSIVKNSKNWSRDKWTETRLTGGYDSRVPAKVSNLVFQAMNKADMYINSYNIYMNRLLGKNDKPLYDTEKRLISHWGLRDELKALYPEHNGKLKQDLILEVMNHIVNGTIPKEFIDNNKIYWNPYTNKCFSADMKPLKSTLEGSNRYAEWFNIFKAQKEVDKYCFTNKTLIDRRFNKNREIPEAKVEKIFIDLLTSPLLGSVASLMKKRLGRDLMPYDLWYTGFKTQEDQSKLDNIVKQQYKDVNTFNQKIDQILIKLGFSQEKAAFLAKHIMAEPSRSAGHARGAAMRGEKALLRIRTDKGNLNYQGFNIAMHELGHTVEQTISMNLIDHTTLEGVPNTAFTEAIAFLFQTKDKQVLGIPQTEKKWEYIIHTYLSTCEIAAMSLVDMYAWRYLYKTKNPSPKGLQDYVMKISSDLWNKYFTKHFGKTHYNILGIYSHMIDACLYLPDYPMGHIISYQIEKYFEKNELATNLERMCKLGNIYPDLWMENAVGSPISPEELIKDTEEAIRNITA